MRRTESLNQTMQNIKVGDFERDRPRYDFFRVVFVVNEQGHGVQG